ncbi:hypothetical protein CDA63_17970 [Hymenobacter amundsenii]|uniref:DUF4113 domain-containing protein n=1 Tax=Hymenobacter amundsenii TaxID=2006685 RepID=A0A246FGS4_9BACT|nr:hypothetical protein CDA63_17970 [Hymenobacter amundsenii]
MEPSKPSVRPPHRPLPAGQPAPWLGRAEHRTPAYTTRLEELLIVS